MKGLGLYATASIKANCFIGLTHIQDENFENGYIRTPVGAFVNHSDVPNCEFYKEDDYIILRTIRPINVGHELTAEYWLYNIEKQND